MTIASQGRESSGELVYPFLGDLFAADERSLAVPLFAQVGLDMANLFNDPKPDRVLVCIQPEPDLVMIAPVTNQHDPARKFLLLAPEGNAYLER